MTTLTLSKGVLFMALQRHRPTRQPGILHLVSSGGLAAAVRTAKQIMCKQSLHCGHVKSGHLHRT